MNSINLWDAQVLVAGDRVAYKDIDDGLYYSSIISDVAQEGTSTSTIIINLEDGKTIIIDIA